MKLQIAVSNTSRSRKPLNSGMTQARISATYPFMIKARIDRWDGNA